MPSAVEIPPDSIGSRAGLDKGQIADLIEVQRDRFEKLADASLFIAGATGWFGVWLLDCLLAADDYLSLGLRITALSRNPSKFGSRFPQLHADSRLTWLTGDVRTFTADLPAHSHVIHAATDTMSDGSLSAVRDSFDTIVEGTRRVLGPISRNARSVLLISSGAIYGAAPEGKTAFAEDDGGGPIPNRTQSAYAEGKRAAEFLAAAAAADGVPVKIARCFAFVGPHMPFHKHFAIGNFIADAVSGREITVRSDGRPLRSYLYMSDLVASLLSVLIDGAPGRAYNVGSDECLTIENLARRVDRLLVGRGVSIQGIPSHWGEHYVPDIRRISTELGFRARITLDEAIVRTAAWYRAQNSPILR